MKRIKQALQEEDLWTPENCLFLLGMQYVDIHPDMLEYLSKFPDAELLAKKFLEFSDNKWILKIEIEKKDLFREYINRLSKYHVTTNGHLNNPLNYSIQRNSNSTKQAFAQLLLEIPDLNVDRLAKITSKYYGSSDITKPTGLGRYLSEEAVFAYYDEEYLD